MRFTRKSLYSHYAIAGAATNLFYLPVTRLVLIAGTVPRASGFFLDRNYYAALLLNLVVMTLALGTFITGVRFVDRTRAERVYTGLLALFALVLVRRLRKYEFLIQGRWADLFDGVPFLLYVIATSLIIVTAIIIALRFTRKLKNVLEGTFYVLAPFWFFVCVQLAWTVFVVNPRSVTVRPGTTPQPPHPRIVVLVFDELDRRAITTFRAPSLSVPEFDRLVGESLVATNAATPRLGTETAIPSLLSGLEVDSLARGSIGTLSVRLAGERSMRRWEVVPNLFDQLESEGFEVGVVGWFHPYCNDLARDTSKCWTFAPTSLPPAELGLPKTAIAMALSTPRFGEGGIFHERREYLQLRADKIVVDPRLTLAYVHFSVPHAPYYRHRDGNGYLGNLEVADKSLGRLRRTMEDAGIWESSTVIVTSDHGATDYQLGIDVPHRANDVRSREVPFIVKLPGRMSSTVFDGQFSTVILKDLVIDLAYGRLGSHGDVVRWLERHEQSYACTAYHFCRQQLTP